MGFHYSPKIITSGLQIALDAKNPKSYPGSGLTWYDLSGNGRNFTWNSTSWNNEGYFLTSGKRATGPASNSVGIDNSSGYTVMINFKTLSGGSNGAFNFAGSPSSRGIFMHPGWTNDTIYFDQGGCCNADQRITYYNADIISSNWSVVVLRSTVATRSIFYNGIKVTNTTTAAANINLSSTAIDLGDAEAYDWNGNLASFYVYNRGLSDEECVQNSRALMSRFGL